ncbi:MAG: glycosyltransferase [Candidatus Aquicultor secundus]|uniref:Glycosyltransferase n=2 Tax=Candidatus Aquicultor secundus TaxID=1973895 RepID=A0A2M7TAK1_9ACTN|nr:glycosyltransferase family 4 protein [Candidatus Aquicultor secundus]NCO66773.1 glycosyltransferase family 4 protein [Solirubrobacter sp.]PIU26664.1 MAG: glycosyltransferase [Candidatus Aquicultor secundus]PIW21856.1 MAG: glycosyltransferase [Candidatus Aquicultor secundus]PIX52191.1 MAG: glycosyltransferase [Candidatus Aquicultor secundus]PIY41577.1 MAG: glycosyltransferase [Candidatus Aquicultor secundus]
MLSSMRKIASQQLKIALIAPPWFPVPPTGYGGIELVVSILAEGLCRRGHDVTLFASGDSVTQARLVSVFDTATFNKLKENVHLENIQSLAAYERAGEFDIIHDHDGYGSRLLGALTSRLLAKPVIATMHGPAEPYSLGFYQSLASDLLFVAISEYQRSSFSGIDFLATIPNAIKINDYPFSENADDYLLFVGRMSEEKGARQAVSVANKLGKKLVMIGKCSEANEIKYFNEYVKPILGNNTEYLGEVDLATKLELYRNAECLLFPIQWPEPFGLVMIESMACGTPVVAIRNGSVPEIVHHGRTGFIVEDEEGMVEAVKNIEGIERLECRKRVVEEYNEEVFIDRHELAYENALTLNGQRKAGLSAHRL